MKLEDEIDWFYETFITSFKTLSLHVRKISSSTLVITHLHSSCFHQSFRVVASNLIDKDWIGPSVYILNVGISVPLYSHSCSHSVETIVSYIRNNSFIYSKWSFHLLRMIVINQGHLRALWSDFIFVTSLRRRRFSHLVFMSIDYAQISDNDRNNDRDNDLDSKSLHKIKLDSKLIIRWRIESRMRLVIEPFRK